VVIIARNPTREEEVNAIRVRALELTRVLLGPFHVEDDNILGWCEVFLRLASAASAGAVDRLEADSKFSRSLTIVLILGWPVYILSRGVSAPLILGAGLPILPVTFVWWYAKYRGTSSEELSRQKAANLSGPSDIVNPGFIQMMPVKFSQMF
jgi:hypothetical protein